MTALLFICMIVIAYLVGSVCSAVIVSKIFDLPDPRIEGSKNPGATNVLRLAGKKYAAIVLIADMLKGLLPVLLARHLTGNIDIIGFTCLAAVLGHMYPIFFNFKGGKGVATALGAFLGFHLFLGVLVIFTWVAIANITRYSSLASISAMFLAPFYSLYTLRTVKPFFPLAIIAMIVIYQHRNNITRLLDGTEPKINFSKENEEEIVSKHRKRKTRTPKNTKLRNKIRSLKGRVRKKTAR